MTRKSKKSLKASELKGSKISSLPVKQRKAKEGLLYRFSKSERTAFTFEIKILNSK